MDDRLNRLEAKIDDIAALPMRTLKWVGGLVIGAAITLLTQNFILHEQTAQNTQAAVTQAVTASAIVSKHQAVANGGQQPYPSPLQGASP